MKKLRVPTAAELNERKRRYQAAHSDPALREDAWVESSSSQFAHFMRKSIVATSDERLKPLAEANRQMLSSWRKVYIVLNSTTWSEYRSKPQRRTVMRKRPSLKSLTYFADLWPLGLRRRLKALAGDYDADIRAMHKQHRYRMARWNALLAWGHALWYVVRGPVDGIVTWAIKAWKG
jgi:hypothetical protein